MTYQEFIDLYTKKVIKKKDRDLVFETIHDESFINDFYASSEYKKSREKKLPLFSYVLMNSFNEAKPLFSKENVNLKQILPGIVFKQIQTVKKLSHFHILSENDIPVFFSPINKNKPDELFINRIIQNNLPFAVDFFNKFNSFLNDEQYFYTDKYIKLSIINALNLNNETKLKNEICLILKNYPFLDFNDKVYKEGTYELLKLTMKFDSPLYNYETFIEECRKVKLTATEIVDLFDYFFFKKGINSNRRDENIGNAQFYNFLKHHIEKDILIPNFLNTINNLSDDHRSFDYNMLLPPMLAHFNPKSFTVVDTQKLDKDANALHYMLNNDIMPETSINTRIHYLRTALDDRRKSHFSDFNIPYIPKNVLNVLKTLPLDMVENHTNINAVFLFNYKFYRDKITYSRNYYDDRSEERKNVLKDSHKVIDYLFKNKLYPNTQKHFINKDNFSLININNIEDKIVQNKIKKTEDNTVYFMNFIEDVLDNQNLSFYIHRKGFIDDFYKNRDGELITSFFEKGLMHKSEELFNSKTKPFFEQYQIKQALKENNLYNTEEPSYKKRRI